MQPPYKKALVLLSASQLCSRWDQISLLVRLINYEGNNQDEKWLHLTVKICLLTTRHQAGSGHTWVLAETQTAWIDALPGKNRKAQILQNIFWITWPVICMRSHEKVQLSEAVKFNLWGTLGTRDIHPALISPLRGDINKEPNPYLPHLLV